MRLEFPGRFNDDQVKHILAVAADLYDLRHSLRLLCGVSNADVRCFGGSSYLQTYVQRAVTRDLLISLRRHRDRARRDEQGVASVRRLLEDLGRAEAVTQLEAHAPLKRVADIATRRLAHALLQQPVEESVTIDLFESGHVLCCLFLEHAYVQLAGNGDLDPPRGRPDDSWVAAIRNDGIPLFDFQPVDIFVNREFLAPELR